MTDHDPNRVPPDAPSPGAPYAQQGYGPPPAYPQGPPQPPPKAKGGGCGKAMLITAVVLVGLIAVGGIIGAIAGGGDDDDDDTADRTEAVAGATESNGQPGDTSPPATTADSDDGPEVYAIGETAHTGEFDVTVHGKQDPYVSSNEFDTPPDGQRFVAVEATVTNTSDEPTGISTLVGTELLDQLDRPWSIALAGLDLPQLDAITVAPGEARRGWVVFAVPPDATDLRIRIKGNLTANGSVFQL